jgi:hypothetical protein
MNEAKTVTYVHPSFGPVLRELRGDSVVGEGPVEIMLRAMDFNVTELVDARGQKQSVPATTLIAFTAQSYREIGDDHWEFRVSTPSSAGPASGLLYVHGTDILTCRMFSKVLG